MNEATWVGAVCRMFASAKTLMEFVCDSEQSLLPFRRFESLVNEPCPLMLWDGQMLLPGIVEPHRWEHERRG